MRLHCRLVLFHSSHWKQKAASNLELGAAAFVVYDNAARRVMAARDAAGSQNFFWGFSPDGSMMFSCDLNDLSGCEPSATAFPSGAPPSSCAAL